jgi:hypothetical protein
MILVMVDAGSKYLDAIPMRNANTTETIRALRTLMATHGLVDTIVSDNGSVFTSQEFTAFLKGNGIRHVRTPPYSACSNGMCERMVQVIKDGLKKYPQGDIYKRLAVVLMNNRRMPLAVMGNVSPAELLFGRRIKTRLDLLKDNNRNAVEAQQEKWPGVHKRARSFEAGEPVYLRKHTGTEKWATGIVEEQRSPHSIIVQQDNGVMSHHAPRQLRSRQMDTLDNNDWNDIIIQQPQIAPSGTTATEIVPVSTTSPTKSTPSVETMPRRSLRQHKPVQRLGQ